MKISFLGTSAATSFPLPFCNCKVCEFARVQKGKDFRKRSSILINEDLIIDFGPDVMSSSMMHNIPLNKIRYYLQTHAHSDHFDASQFSTRIAEYAVENVKHLDLYASKLSIMHMSLMLKNEGYISDLFSKEDQERLNISVKELSHFQITKVGNYQIIALPSNHDEQVDSLIYVVIEDNITLLYATDSDDFYGDVWSFLQRQKLCFDCIILDHTYGSSVNGGGHLNAGKFINHINRFKSEKLLKAKSRIFATHISHEGNPNHDDLVKFGKKHNYEVAYDGLVINYE